MSEQYVSLDEHREFVKRIEAEDNRQNKRIEIIEAKQAQISELVASVKVLAVNVENIAKEINKQSQRLDEIEGIPKNVAKAVIVCATFLGAILCISNYNYNKEKSKE